MAQTSLRNRVPPAQEKVVIARSGNKCAYPGCGLDLTIDPKTDGDRPKATGKVAHIAAASPGGPRYDASMTPEERGSAENLIYLCGPHHGAVERAVRNALGEVTYEELTVVCTVIASTPVMPQQLGVELALPLQEKIKLNKLGQTSVQRITDGLSKAARVEEFISFQTSVAPSFGRSLVARFKSDYYAARAENLDPDAVFDYLVETAIENAGPRDSPQVRAAALAVIAYLFEICEVFERELILPGQVHATSVACR